MSVMCKMGSHCSAKKGMCGHEKVMLLMVMTIIAVVSLVYWLA